MALISVIIVSFEHAATLGRTLETLLCQRDAEFEVLVLDNHSRDASLEIARGFMPRIRVLASRTNRGFCGGNNDAARAARGDLLLFCNPDLELDDAWALHQLDQAYRDDPTLGIVGWKLYFPGRTRLQHCGGVIDLPSHTPLRGYGEEDRGQYSTPEEVDFVEGSALAIPRTVWDRLGGFDEIFWPAFYEETDLCVRARRSGVRVTFRPELTAIHHVREKAAEVEDGWYWRTLQTHRILFSWRYFGAWRFLREVLPAEARWLAQPGMRYLRVGVLRAYLRAAKRLAGGRLGLAGAPPSDWEELLPQGTPQPAPLRGAERLA